MEISELTEDRFRAMFRLTYTGDAYIVLKTVVQANPLSQVQLPTIIHQPFMQAAAQPFPIPLQLKISNVRLRGIMVLVVDQQRGITLVFKNDPLEKIHVSSTFDRVPSVRRFLQRQIEEKIRILFAEDLPQMVHQLSLLHLQKKNERMDGMEEQRSRMSSFSQMKDSSFMIPSSSESQITAIPSSVITEKMLEDYADKLVKQRHSRKWVLNSSSNDSITTVASLYFENFDDGIILCKSLGLDRRQMPRPGFHNISKINHWATHRHVQLQPIHSVPSEPPKHVSDRMEAYVESQRQQLMDTPSLLAQSSSLSIMTDVPSDVYSSYTTLTTILESQLDMEAKDDASLDLNEWQQDTLSARFSLLTSVHHTMAPRNSTYPHILLRTSMSCTQPPVFHKPPKKRQIRRIQLSQTF
jgi:hypothetical protein